MKIVSAVVFCALLVAGFALAQEDTQNNTRSSLPKTEEKVTLTLEIRDTSSGLNLDAKMNFPKGTNAFTAMKSIVQLKPEKGGFITDICGVQANGDERYWALYVDGESSEVGINSLKLEKETTILWKTEERF